MTWTTTITSLQFAKESRQVSIRITWKFDPMRFTIPGALESLYGRPLMSYTTN